MMTTAPQAPAAADDHVTFVAPLPGLGDIREFTLRTLDENATVFALHGRDTDAGRTRLFLVHAAAHVPGYAPEITAMHLALLGTDAEPASEDDIATLVVLNPEGPDGLATVNLLAPVLVDTRSHRAVQVVLEGSWPLRAPLAATSDSD